MCLTCLDATKKAEIVVDWLELRTLADLESKSDALSEILLGLPCGHAITVESGDGLLALTQYYSRDQNGWIRPLMIDADVLDVKICPNCRHEISSVKRYGRPINHPLLDRHGKRQHPILAKRIADAQSIISSLQADISKRAEALQKATGQMKLEPVGPLTHR